MGPDHPQITVVLRNWAMLYHEQERLEEAEKLYVQALALREELLGPDHHQVALILEPYAELLRETGREREADKMAARAAAIDGLVP